MIQKKEDRLFTNKKGIPKKITGMKYSLNTKC